MVNTFFTEAGTNFGRMAQTLDRQRRFKQAVEAKEILLTIERKREATDPRAKIGFKNHPIVVMWENYTECLKAYFNAFYEQLLMDGFRMERLQKMDVSDVFEVPWFLYYMPLVYSHQARLFQKDPVYYQDKFTFPKVYLSIGYIWIRPKMCKEEYFALKDAPEKIADKLEEKYQHAAYCQMEYKSGANKGKICNRILKSRCVEYCGVHSKKRKAPGGKCTES
jgi:hypothetical protein